MSDLPDGKCTLIAPWGTANEVDHNSVLWGPGTPRRSNVYEAVLAVIAVGSWSSGTVGQKMMSIR